MLSALTRRGAGRIAAFFGIVLSRRALCLNIFVRTGVFFRPPGLFETFLAL